MLTSASSFTSGVSLGTSRFVVRCAIVERKQPGSFRSRYVAVRLSLQAPRRWAQHRASPSGHPQPGDHQRHRWMMRLWHWASLIREASTVYVVPDSDFMASDAYEGRRSRSSHFHVEAACATEATTRLE